MVCGTLPCPMPRSPRPTGSSGCPLSLARPRARRFTWALACTIALFAAPITSTPANAEDLDILGSWYVLVHYKDDSTANPLADRWLDLVWVFEMKGSRLEWREYPLVVFEDTSGRFEPRAGNPRARTLAAWEPNAAQRAVIERGPHVNDRGSKTKTLKGSPTRGWKTVDRPGIGMGANVVGYRESLRIDDPEGLPVFSRIDSLGNAARGSSEGSTVYTTTEVRSGGDVIVGTYARDGIRHGVFRLRRTPPPRGLIEKDGTPNERLVESFKATGGIGAMGLGSSTGPVREGFDEGDDF